MKKITAFFLIISIIYIGSISEANKTHICQSCYNSGVHYCTAKETSISKPINLHNVIPKRVFLMVRSETYHEVPEIPSHEFDNISREPKNRVQEARREIVGDTEIRTFVRKTIDF